MTVLRQEYRDGMARLGAAVNIITTDGPAGRSAWPARLANPYGRGFDVIYFRSEACKNKWNQERWRREGR
jgi:hypothetical protein